MSLILQAKRELQGLSGNAQMLKARISHWQCVINQSIKETYNTLERARGDANTAAKDGRNVRSRSAGATKERHQRRGDPRKGPQGSSS